MKIKIGRTWLIALGSLAMLGVIFGGYSIWRYANAANMGAEQTSEPASNDSVNSGSLNNSVATKKVAKSKSSNSPSTQSSNSDTDDSNNLSSPADNTIPLEPTNETNGGNGGGSSFNDDQVPWGQGPSDQ